MDSGIAKGGWKASQWYVLQEQFLVFEVVFSLFFELQWLFTKTLAYDFISYIQT